MSGVPFLSGFYSKDALIEFLFVVPTTYSSIFYNISVLSALFTIMYSLKLLYYIFLAKPNGFKTNYVAAFEDYSIIMLYLFSLLSFFSVFSGYFFSKIFVGLGSNFFFESIFNFSKIHSYSLLVDFFFLQSYSLWYTLKLVPFLIFLPSFFIFYLLIVFFNNNFFLHTLYIYIYNLIYNGFFYNFLYINFFFGSVLKIC